MTVFYTRALSLISQFLAHIRFGDILSFALIILVIFLVFFMLRKIMGQMLKKHATPQVQHLVNKIITYAGFLVAGMTAFQRLGIDFTALLGAAGIVGVALGFAAQTSVSNVISGLFVLTERTFKIGDILRIDGVTGVVESIDLLSVRLKTFDNQLVRIPNETIIKTNLVNLTHFEYRRVNMKIAVAYGSNLERVKAVLLDIAGSNEFARADPPPIVIFENLGSSSIEILLGVWCKNESYLDLQNSLFIAVCSRFKSEGIEIPFPQLDVHYSGGAGETWV